MIRLLARLVVIVALANLILATIAIALPRRADAQMLIAFESRRQGTSIHIMHEDGTNVRQLTDSFTFDTNPIWVPDRVVYESITLDGQSNIYSLRFFDNQPQPKRLTDDGAAWGPTYVAHLNRIEYRSRTVNTTRRLWSMTVEGTDHRVETLDPLRIELGLWSVDGRYILGGFTRLVIGDLWVLDRVSGDDYTITAGGGREWDPSWSPNAEWVLFSSGRDESLGEIYKVRVDGTDLTRLTDSPGMDSQAAWSPDGAWIAFSSERNGQADIYKMRPDGSNVTRLTTHPADDRNPTWISIPTRPFNLPLISLLLMAAVFRATSGDFLRSISRRKPSS